ncbi:hypothetical protein OS175_08620 [Marinicella sp. S1101]|uniref:hypothetical protein n=1 Tax=Marinicella marina TaxID=2996016 RepID=UPI002260F9BA|nr:hypothetical protein [Marinicella marina]MCX7553941.1 hypothetical protein [Marinicella marina]
MKKLILLTFLVTLPAWSQQFEPYFEADLPNPAIAITKDDAGEWLEITVNEWHDSVYTKTGNKHYIFQQGYNYKKKQGFIRTYTPERELVNEKYAAEYDGMVVREEMLEGFEIFKKNPQVKALLKNAEEPITLHGGFNFEDDNKHEPCYKGNRCVHVFASTPTISVLAHAIVKLSDRSVPYPSYDIDEATKAAIEQRRNRILRKRGKL